MKKKLDEILPTLTSPIPSPDINAPSPSPDSDLELPDNTASTPVTIAASTEPASGKSNQKVLSLECSCNDQFRSSNHCPTTKRRLL